MIARTPALHEVPAQGKDTGRYPEETHRVAHVEKGHAQSAQICASNVDAQETNRNANRRNDGPAHGRSELPTVNEVFVVGHP